jgi:hypothetical protein
MNLKNNNKISIILFKNNIRPFVRFDKKFSCKDYAVSTQPPGIRVLLDISANGMFTISDQDVKTPFGNQNMPSDTKHSFIDGYLYCGNWFTGIDILISKGIDVKSYSLKRRYKYLLDVCKEISHCEPIEYSIGNIYEKVKKIMKSRNTIMFIPIHANYINKRSFIYMNLQYQTIIFKITKKTPNSSYNIYNLYTESDSFKGTKQFPFDGTISLTLDEQKHLSDTESVSTILFNWNNSRFTPLSSHTKVSSIENVEQTWNIINTFKDYDILKYLKHNKDI